MARCGYVLRCGALCGFALTWSWHGVALAGGIGWVVVWLFGSTGSRGHRFVYSSEGSRC